MDREEYNQCYSNGKKHIDLAKRLGSENDFGTAVTFLVLGIEELIKFLVIQMSLGEDKRFSDKELNKLFSSHTDKHKIIIEFLEATKPIFAENFVLSLFNKMNNLPLTDELKEVDNNRFKELGSMVGLTEKHLTEEEIEAFIEWLARNADKHKNKGLYVDRLDKSKDLLTSRLTSPTETKKEDYELILKFADS
ncbi:MAG TPA: AbiV family abortive infection protein, partial [Cyclobacteriaceae bacterium]|nr:AbiV family abortive infection protein [Cyclobacteriaceae bacterium]